MSDRVVVMNKGRMEQVGTPFEVYNFPTTTFVANFVGTLNTADAEVVDPARGFISVGGVQFVTSDEDLQGKRKGDKIRISIRPERLGFEAEGRKENVVDCVVENITFLGSVVRIQIQIGGVDFNMDTFNRPSLKLPEVGDQVRVTCSKKAVLVLSE